VAGFGCHKELNFLTSERLPAFCSLATHPLPLRHAYVQIWSTAPSRTPYNLSKVVAELFSGYLARNPRKALPLLR